jgi:hypothetical protein
MVAWAQHNKGNAADVEFRTISCPIPRHLTLVGDQHQMASSLRGVRSFDITPATTALAGEPTP